MRISDWSSDVCSADLQENSEGLRHMARFTFNLPDIGDGISEAEIVNWHVAVDDIVKEDQPIADMMTDNATVEMESPVAGQIVAIGGEIGDRVPTGSLLVEIEVDGTGDRRVRVKG